MTSGAGAVAVARGPRRSIVTRLVARSPLKLLAPRNAGDAAWVFAATFGGGLLPGDVIALEVGVGRGATALVGTQAQTKVFRAAALGAAQRGRVTVAEGGLLVSLPDPVVAFAGARWEQTLELRLDGGSAVLVEGLTAGRAARGERWAFARFASRTRVFAPELVVEDALLLDATHGDLGERLGRIAALATVTAVGPRAAAVAAEMRRVARESPLRAEPRIAASDVAGGVVARVAGVSVEAVGQAVRRLLGGLPGLLGDDPFARKW